MRKMLIGMMLVLTLIVAGCSSPVSSSAEDEKKKEEEKKEYCTEIKTALVYDGLINRDFSNGIKRLSEDIYDKEKNVLSKKGTYIEFNDSLKKNIITNSIGTPYFVVYYADYDGYNNKDGKKNVNKYKYEITSKGGMNLGGKEGSDPIIFAKKLNLEELNDLPRVKVTEYSKGKGYTEVYNKSFSDYKFTEFGYNSFEKVAQRIDFHKNINAIDYSFIYADKLQKKKNIIDLSSTSLKGIFEFSYDEYVGYLEKAYNILKEKKMDEIKEQAYYSYTVIDSSREYDSVFPDDDNFNDEDRNKIYAEVDAVYSSFDSFKNEYFRGYDINELKGSKFCIPKNVVRDLSSSAGTIKFNRKEYHTFFSCYGIFFNNAPGAGASEEEVQAFKNSNERIKRMYEQYASERQTYQWHTNYGDNHTNLSDITKIGNVVTGRERFYETNVSEVTGGWTYRDKQNTIELLLSSFKYVEIVKDGVVKGKLRNSFMCYADDGTALKTVEWVGAAVETKVEDIDYIHDNQAFIDKYNLLFKENGKYSVIGNGSYSALSDIYFWM